MKKTYILAMLPILMALIQHPALAEGSISLTPEQISHEKALKELRRQKEIIKENHDRALLLAECRDLGIDCSSGTTLEIMEPVEKSQPKNTEFNDVQDIQGLISTPVMNGSDTPVLEAIQNQSAQLKYNGKSEWAMVGNKVGQWQVVHIDASKVRLKNLRNPNTIKTLLLRW
ncbi:MAG: hypothetical protein VX829_13660 [Pseudomonadota bacterium]|uniref:hypothetical protein n=1 Tax=Methylophaga TaxID=40222 RepID=UPI00058B088E|nr:MULTISPECIES: hypothetical protein [Methylophaga]MEC9413709.1 hypothetical protein [Pseudomonadota bacterium]HIC46856.1 hypothetical protein [Methylophaga sp.]